MKHNFRKKLLAAVLLSALVLSSGNNMAYAKTAKAPTLNVKKSISLQVGTSKKIKVKSGGVSKIVKVSWKSSKNCIKLSRKSGTSVKATAVKKGKATLTANVKYIKKLSADSSYASKKLKCKIKAVNKVSGNINNTAYTSAQPSATASVNNNTSGDNNINGASPVPSPTATPIPSGTLLSVLSPYVENVGTCVSYNSWGSGFGGGWGGGFGGWGNNSQAGTSSQLFDDNTTKFIKENYNSLTAENQMKSSYILGNSANLISVSEARSQGYYIPEGYTESNVPTLSYTNIDSLMKYASENGLRIRYHGLLWHEQASNWFFRKGYSDNAAFVTPEIMDERIEFFIKNVMNHVYSSEYKDVIYCWDVVNEYFHMTECISRIGDDKNDDVKCFYEVYGDSIFEDPADPANSPVKTNPAYVKKAFKHAYDVLKSFGLENKVELVYNDYDTDFPEVRECMLKVGEYINSKDELNPDGVKLLTTFGMQGHDKMGIHTIAGHKDTIEAVKAAGYNLQYTEADLSLKGHTREEQLKYWNDWITLVVNESKNGAHFTGFSWWGLSDSGSWLGSGESPLLCGSSISDKKPAYYTVISAAIAVGNN